MPNLKDLEKGFILDGDAELNNVEKLIEKISKFSQVDLTGHVGFKDPKIEKKLSIKDKILLVIATRFLANKLQEKLDREITISNEVNGKEISDMLRVKPTVISARLKDLKDEKKILSKKAGVFSIAPYHIESFLDQIEKKKDS